MRSFCPVLVYLALSGKSWEKVILLLPLKACAPTPMRNTGLFDQASARRASSMAPRTLFRSVNVTVSVGVPTVCIRFRLVSRERSRNVDVPRPSVQLWPIGNTPSMIGKRAVIVLAEPDDVVTFLNSGEY